MMLMEMNLFNQLLITLLIVCFIRYIYDLKLTTCLGFALLLLIPLSVQVFLKYAYVLFISQLLFMLLLLKYLHPENAILEYVLLSLYMFFLRILSFISMTWLMNLFSHEVIFPLSYTAFFSDLLFFLMLILSAKTIKKLLSKTREYSQTLLIVLILLITLYSSYLITIFQKNELLLESSFEIILITLLVFFVYRLVKSLVHMEKENTVMKLYTQELELNRKNYDSVLENMQETKKMNHDMKHLLRGLLDYYHQGDYQSLEKAIRTELEMTQYNTVVNTGNQSMDLILSSYIPILKKNNIEFIVNYFDGNIQIDKIDLYTLVGNLVDNAIENCSSKITKKIIFDIYEKEEYLYIDLKNTCDHNPLQQIETFQTTKENKKDHGIGLKSIDMIVKKYEGSFTHDYSLYYLTSHVRLKNKEY